MCLLFANKPKRTKGYGYKIVRKTKRGNYRPWFLYKSRSGNGQKYDTSKTATKVTTLYRLNETSVANIKRYPMMSSLHNQLYSPGIHIYKSLKNLFSDHPYAQDMEIAKYPVKIAIIKVRYERAVAQDNNVIVALEMTPIKEIASSR